MRSSRGPSRPSGAPARCGARGHVEEDHQRPVGPVDRLGDDAEHAELAELDRPLAYRATVGVHTDEGGVLLSLLDLRLGVGPHLGHPRGDLLDGPPRDRGAEWRNIQQLLLTDRLQTVDRAAGQRLLESLRRRAVGPGHDHGAGGRDRMGWISSRRSSSASGAGDEVAGGVHPLFIGRGPAGERRHQSLLVAEEFPSGGAGVPQHQGVRRPLAPIDRVGGQGRAEPHAHRRHVLGAARAHEGDGGADTGDPASMRSGSSSTPAESPVPS